MADKFIRFIVGLFASVIEFVALLIVVIIFTEIYDYLITIETPKHILKTIDIFKKILFWIDVCFLIVSLIVCIILAIFKGTIKIIKDLTKNFMIDLGISYLAIATVILLFIFSKYTVDATLEPDTGVANIFYILAVIIFYISMIGFSFLYGTAIYNSGKEKYFVVKRSIK